MLNIYVDADACPVKNEVARVAKRCGLKVFYVAQQSMRIPEEGQGELVVVPYDKLDAADDWIAERVGLGDIVVTADIPLADRCIKAGAHVVNSVGRRLDQENIGQMMAMRGLMVNLREEGSVTGGPRPFEAKDRSNFLQALDQIIQDIKRKV